MKKCLVLALLALTLGAALFGATSKISPDLQGLDPNTNVRVIVQYASSSSMPSAQSGGGGLLGGLLNLVGGLVTGVVNVVFSVLNAVVYTVPASSLTTMASDPNVTYISPDRPLTGQLDYSAAAVNASAAWHAKLTGSGVGVAVIDSGINNSPDLSILGLFPRIVYTQDFIGGKGTDQYGHGTHVAGIIGANGAESNCFSCTRSFVGIAPNASLINLRVLDANGQGSDSTVIQAIERAIALKKTYNIRVINLSLGRPIYESYKQDPLCQAVEAAWKAGIVVVTAAGNDGRDNSVGTNGYGTIESPGNDPYVITVGAMKAMDTYSRTDDLVASYSSKGPSALDHVVKPDIMAPGNHVVSLLASGSTLASDPANSVPLSYYESNASSTPSSRFMMLNGTSMATPVVTGAVADMLQGQPWLTPDEVKARLMKTAYKTFPTSSTAVDPVTGQTFVSQYDMLTIGAGYLDLAATLANKDLATGTAMSPTATYDSTSGNVYLVYDPSSTWNDTDVFSGMAVGGTRGAWGTQTVWGTAVVNADKGVWGSQAV
ncbi:MAG TPA: S8 family peptidase, partial [Bryobacteraceae bacterium]|nr:S8 family peptidase [Bryobacteraceae bacterium]